MTRSHVRYKSCRISWTKCQMSWTPLHSWQSKHPSTLLSTGRLCSAPFSSLELLNKSAWRYRKVTLGAGLKCWQAPRESFSLKVQLYKAIVERVKDMAEPFPASTPNLAQHRCVLGLAISQQQQQAARRQKSLGCSPQGRCPLN